MKTETISVIKPRNSQQSRAKKNPKNNVAKIQKKVASPRGEKKQKIVSIQKISNVNELKSLKGINTKNLVANKAENGKTKNTTNDAPVHGKMVATRNDRDEKTRGRLKKKQKINVVEKSVVAVKKEKKVKTEAETIEVPKESKTVEVTQTLKDKKKPTTKIANTGNLKFTKQHVFKTIDTILTLNQKKMESKKSLLPIETSPVYLQVCCIKISNTPRMRIRPRLPHSLIGPLDEVALFVPDLVLGRKQDYEKTVDHWETILRRKGVDCIKQIIPMNSVKTEYSQFEMKRKLAASFDYFLTDGRIAGHLNHLLSKTFLRRRDPPTPVRLEHDDLKTEIDTALCKTCMEIHKFGNSHAMRVGIISMDRKKLAENVWAACKTLAKDYPGGWDNIRAIQLKTSIGMAIPIYVNLATKNSIKRPVIEPKRPRAYETVEGELTTIPGKTTVKLTPEGKIFVKREKDDDDDEAAEESDEEKEQVKEESDDEEDDDEQ